MQIFQSELITTAGDEEVVEGWGTEQLTLLMT
jgi:hypothetical protein